MVIIYFIPFAFIALAALAALIVGGAAVAAVVTFVLKHFVVISIVLWAVILLITGVIHSKEKGFTGKLYQLTTALSALPLYLIFYRWLTEMNEYLIHEKYISMIMDAVGGFFAIAFVAIICLGTILLGDEIREKGMIKTAISVKMLLTTLLLMVMLFLLYRN